MDAKHIYLIKFRKKMHEITFNSLKSIDQNFILATLGARERNLKKRRYVTLDKLISFNLNQKYLKSVVPKFQNP